MSWVKLGVRGVDPEWKDDTTENHKNFQDILAHCSESDGLCGCLHNGAPLTVKHKAVKSTHYLACMPGQGPLHSEECYFFRDDDRSGRSCYIQSVIREEDGHLNIKISKGLSLPKPDDRDDVEQTTPRETGSRRTRGAMTDLGLLHLLWEESKNHEYKNTKKHSWDSVAWSLLKNAVNISCGRKEISDLLCVIRSSGKIGPILEFKDKAQAAFKGSFQLVLICDIAAVDGCNIVMHEDSPGTLRRHLQIVVNDNADLLNKINVSLMTNGRTVGLFRVRVTPFTKRAFRKDNNEVITATVIHGAVMATTDQYIPFDSSHEKRVAEKLVEAGRHFRKPLRYDASRDLVFPDFELLDVEDGKAVPMEVFGMDKEDYNARKEEKIIYYNAHYGITKWWCWIVVGEGWTDFDDAWDILPKPKYPPKARAVPVTVERPAPVAVPIRPAPIPPTRPAPVVVAPHRPAPAPVKAPVVVPASPAPIAPQPKGLVAGVVNILKKLKFW